MTHIKISSTAADKKSHAGRLFEQLRKMAASYQFKPKQRVNESTLAKQLGISRTPLREALNRLSM